MPFLDLSFLICKVGKQQGMVNRVENLTSSQESLDQVAGKALNRPSVTLQGVLGPEEMAAATMLDLSKAI